MASPADTEQFPLREARKIVKDLQAPKPYIYWVDFLIVNTLGWAAILFATLADPFSAAQIAAVAVASLAMYRAVIFIHELSHLKRGTFKLFRFVWNITCGMPMMVPSFTYAGVHIDHHKPQIYGTKEDGEYLPIGIESPWKLILYIVASAIVPLVVAVRFTVFTPISYLHPKLRDLVMKYMSSLVVDLTFVREASANQNDRMWRWQELGAMIFGMSAATAAYFGFLPLTFFAVWYAVVALLLTLNTVRTLVAHAYKNPGDKRMSRADEFADSIDIPGNRFISPLWAPVGLRFHATHHLFPSMPYHNLGEARRRLIAELPDNSLYLRSTRNGLFHALGCLIRDAKAAQEKAAAPQPAQPKEQPVQARKAA